MGEARRRGSFADRKKAAIQRNKAKLIGFLGGTDERSSAALRAGIAPFFARLTASEWQQRRSRIIEALKTIDKGEQLEKAKSVRIQDDEIAWYLFLCQQALDDPLCNELNQLARAAPFFAGIGERWAHAVKVKGLEAKIDEVLHAYRKEPDGLIFEILVALAYAELGWDVELLQQRPPAKSPDMRITRGCVERFVECKRLSRRTGYAEQERQNFLRLWDAAQEVLVQNAQWVWFRGVFHTELASLPDTFLADVFRKSLPIAAETVCYEGEATIQGRLIDRSVVDRHMARFRVKANSPTLSQLLGGDWAPPNSSASILHLVKTSRVADCEVQVLNMYIDEISWACGFTRDFDSAISLNKKAKDVLKHLSDAVKQIPDDRPSIIHLAAETLEGRDVERLRTEKVMDSIRSFITDKPLLGIRLHRFQANQTIDKLWEFDETVEKFDAVPDLTGIPESVVVPAATEFRHGSHWELY